MLTVAKIILGIVSIKCTTIVVHCTSSVEQRYAHSCKSSTLHQHYVDHCKRRHMRHLPLQNIQKTYDKKVCLKFSFLKVSRLVSTAKTKLNIRIVAINCSSAQLACTSIVNHRHNHSFTCITFHQHTVYHRKPYYMEHVFC